MIRSTTAVAVSAPAANVVPFHRPDLGAEEDAAVLKVLHSGWLTTGMQTREFEARFAAYVGARFAVAVNSCTAALHVCLHALGIRAGDEVITPAYTFAATAEIARYLGATPVFVDSDAATLNLDPDAVAAAITPRTKAIIPVHVGGLACDLDAIHALAQPLGIPVLEDAAHALPAWYKGAMIGSLSRATCFSFYATKTLTTGEGGMLCTDDPALAEQCRSLSLHGISKSAWNRYTHSGAWYYEILDAGYKYNMTDLAAALGLVQLQKVETMWRRRQAIAAAYDAAFAQLPQLRTPVGGAGHAWHLYMLRLRPGALAISREAFIEELTRRGIGTSVHFIPLHLHPYYRELYGFEPEQFPVAYEQYQLEISLPIFSAMTDGEVQRTIDAVVEVASEAAR